MKPVFQTIHGDGVGDCFPACIASVLEIDLEGIPNFCTVYKSRWQEELNKWLHQFGLGSLTVAFQDVESPIQKGWCFAAGPCGPEGVMHSVVMKDLKMVHNPHEGWGELDRIVDYTFFVVLDPAVWMAHTCGKCDSHKDVKALQFRKPGAAHEFTGKKEYRCIECRSKNKGRFRFWH